MAMNDEKRASNLSYRVAIRLKCLRRQKKSLDHVTVFIGMDVELAGHQSVPFRFDYGVDIVFDEKRAQWIGIIGAIGYQITALVLFEQAFGLGDIMGLSRCQGPVRQTPQAFHQSMNLGSQPAARVPERLWAVFFAAPAPC